MKRLFVLLAALAAMSVIVAGSAFAAGGTTTCTGDLGGQKVTGNLDVPAGAVCGMWGEVTGNVTVEGVLKSFGSTYDKNVTVNGGSFKSLNYGTTIKGNLIISNSAGDPNPNDTNANGFFAVYTPSHVYGNLIYTGNSAPLYVSSESRTTVDGNFNFSNNTGGHDIAALTVNGQQNIS